MNSYNCTGRLTDDPARRDTTSGVVATFRLAVDGRPKRLWITVEAWAHEAGKVATYGASGRHVAVTGRLVQDEFLDRDGHKQTRYKVVAGRVEFLDDPPSAPDQHESSTQRTQRVSVAGEPTAGWTRLRCSTHQRQWHGPPSSPCCGQPKAAPARRRSPPRSPSPHQATPCSSISTATCPPCSAFPNRAATASPTGSPRPRPSTRSTASSSPSIEPPDCCPAATASSTRTAHAGATSWSGQPAIPTSSSTPAPSLRPPTSMKRAAASSSPAPATSRYATQSQPTTGPTPSILVNEPGRALRAADVERAVGQRVIATVDVDPAVARAIDAGLLAARLPHLLQSQLRAALPSAPAPQISSVPAVSIDSRRPPALHSVISLERTEHGHRPVTVDVHVGAGVPGYEIHGIPDATLRESRDRIRAAVLNSGLAWPDQRITINIAPHSPALDSNLDLAIAAGILASTGQLHPGALDRFAYIGELGLDGSVRNGPGAPEHATIVELTRRPPAAVGHLGELARRYPAAASYGHDLATTQTPAVPAMPAAPGIAADSPAQQIVAQWQHPVAPTPGEAAHPLGGLA